MRLLREKYKTYEGARKRCAFENGLARGEFQRGDKAKHYRYSIVQEGDVWRVARSAAALELNTGNVEGAGIFDVVDETQKGDAQ